jgi:predicted PurR-regulated permease PerM
MNKVSDTITACLVVFIFLVIFVCLFAVADKIHMKNYNANLVREQQENLMKQILVKTGNAWYNPTNGQFEILTNRLER